MATKSNPPVFPGQYRDDELRKILVAERDKAFSDPKKGLSVSLQDIHKIISVGEGLTLMELYAGLAMNGLFSLGIGYSPAMIKTSWDAAEEMIKERERRMK